MATPTNYNPSSQLLIFYCRKFLDAVSMVTSSDLRDIANKYFSSLFDPSKVACSVCCSTSKVDEIKKGFEE